MSLRPGSKPGTLDESRATGATCAGAIDPQVAGQILDGFMLALGARRAGLAPGTEGERDLAQLRMAFVQSSAAPLIVSLRRARMRACSSTQAPRATLIR